MDRECLKRELLAGIVIMSLDIGELEDDVFEADYEADGSEEESEDEF